jgi:hypothetical protein
MSQIIESPDTLEDGHYYVANCEDAVQHYADNQVTSRCVEVKDNRIQAGKTDSSFFPFLFYIKS